MNNVLISLSGKCSTSYDLKELTFDEIIGVDNGTAHLFDRSLIPSKVLGDFDTSFEFKGRSCYVGNGKIEDLEQVKNIVLLGTNPRKEASVINARIRKAFRNN